MAKKLMTIEDRFLSKIAKSPEDGGCWLWTGYLDKDGYGTFNPESKTLKKAHRFSYLMHVGPIAEGLCVCHSCDRPSCCNPAHLFLGTATDNDKDRDNKGRQAKGERIGNSRFTASEILEIRRMRESGMTQQAIANKVGAAQPVISAIVLRKTWKHI